MQNNYPALDMFPARDIFASLHFEGNFRPAEGDMRWYMAHAHVACIRVNIHWGEPIGIPQLTANPASPSWLFPDAAC